MRVCIKVARTVPSKQSINATYENGEKPWFMVVQQIRVRILPLPFTNCAYLTLLCNLSQSQFP